MGGEYVRSNPRGHTVIEKSIEGIFVSWSEFAVADVDQVYTAPNVNPWLNHLCKRNLQ